MRTFRLAGPLFPPSPKHAPTLRLALASALLHGAVAAGLLWPALSSGGQRLVGARDTETFPFLWGTSWMRQSLLEAGAYPVWTDLLDHPAGGALWLKDPLTMILMLPVQILFDVPTALTVGELAQFTLAGVAMTLLARHLGAARGVSLVAGLCFAFCPHALGEAYNANTEALNHGWLALWLWTMLGAFRDRSWPWILGGAAALFGLLMGNQYYGLSGAMASPVLLAAAVVDQRKLGTSVRGLLAVGAAVALGLLLFAPMGRLLLQTMAAPDQLTLLDADAPLQVPYVSDLWHFVEPFRLLSGQHGPTPFQDLVYPGLALTALALLAPLARPRSAMAWTVAGLALGFGLLSLGPAISVDGQIWVVEGEPVRTPWRFMVTDRPLVGAMTLPHRLASVTGLFLALGLALTLDRLGALLAPLHPLLAGAAPLLGLAAFAEILVYPGYELPLATVSLHPPPHVLVLAQADHPGAVLTLPTGHGINERAATLWWQVLHGRPIAASLRHDVQPAVILGNPWLEAVAGARVEPVFPAPDPQVPERLRAAGYAYVVLSGAFLQMDHTEGLEARWAQGLNLVLGEALALPDETMLYPLSPEARTAAQTALDAMAAEGTLDRAAAAAAQPGPGAHGGTQSTPPPGASNQPADCTPGPAEGTETQTLVGTTTGAPRGLLLIDVLVLGEAGPAVLTNHACGAGLPFALHLPADLRGPHALLLFDDVAGDGPTPGDPHGAVLALDLDGSDQTLDPVDLAPNPDVGVLSPLLPR